MAVKRGADGKSLTKNPCNEGDGRMPMEDTINPAPDPVNNGKAKAKKINEAQNKKAFKPRNNQISAERSEK